MSKDLINFILEIGVEELPSRLLQPVSDHIKTEITSVLEENKIKFAGIETHSTPRRLFFYIDSLEKSRDEESLEVKGPPEKAALDQDKKFTQAALGFAKKNNVNEADLVVKDGYVYAQTIIPALPSKSVLEEALAKIISSVPGERYMRWGNGSVKFSRPLQWIAAVIDDKGKNETLKFNVENLEASNLSYGHRFLDPASFEIKSKDQYFEQLKKQGVYLEEKERQEIIKSKAQELAKSINGEALIEDDLLNEVTGLIENPSPILCSFDESYLKLPECVIITVMAAHQRYFPIFSTGTEKKLLPYFITVSNNPLKEAEQNIREGNEKVIIPRLKDAEFFFNEDNKISLEDRISKLEKINFQSGTMAQKVKRIEKIAQHIFEELKPTFDENPAKLDSEKLDSTTESQTLEAAKLCKSDLTSQMVFEFTELQGEIGETYAVHQGKSKETAKAIGEHYKPRFAGDDLPSTISGKIASVADRIDSLVVMFALGKSPKGSADPFALRRQANGLLEVIIHSHLILDLDKLVDTAAKIAEEDLGTGRMIKKHKGKGDKKEVIEVPELDWSKGTPLLKEFLTQRLGFVFEMLHKNKEVNTAVLASGNPLQDLNKKHMLIHFVYGLQEEKDFPQFLEAAKRISRIGDKNIGSDVQKDKFVTDYEKKLDESFGSISKIASEKVINEVPIGPEELLRLTGPINEFFDNVLVNDENEEVKKNRHALVNRASNLLGEIADFNLIN